MRRSAPKDPPLRLAPTRARHEIRVWLGRDLYDRVLREAAARGTTTSHCVRECLDEYFVMKQQAALALGIRSEALGAPQAAGQRLSHALLDTLERRVVNEIRGTEIHLDDVAEKIRLLACMLDQAYQGLVGRLPEVPPDLREARIATADEATRRWRRAVRSLFREGGPESGDAPDSERAVAPPSLPATAPVRVQRRRTPEATGTD